MTKRKQWLLYGATGYTGTHIAEVAVAKGYRPLIAGRREKEVKALAERLGLEWRVVDLGDAAALKSLVGDCSVVMHAAGPYYNTFQPMLEACLATGAHYLDLTGEIPVYEALAAASARARKAGIMVMPGVGFDMVPGDCLALSLKRLMPNATHLDIGNSFEGTLTRGTIKSAMTVGPKPLVRREHRLVEVEPMTREFDFGPGRCGGRASTNVSTFGDICVGWHTTGIPNVTSWQRPAPEFAALANVKTMADVEALPAGPSDLELKTIPTLYIGEVRNQAGDAKAIRLVTPQVYAITFDLAATISQRVHEGTFRPGYQTPANVFGEDFILEFDGCSMQPWQPG
jgi:short subunit dehydrogenase-like uncharacterized protein